MRLRTAIVGGGAAGFFLAICLKERMPQMQVDIFERGKRVLRKVSLSGGGRCNVTNTFQYIHSLQEAYPRGHRLLQRLFHRFDSEAAMEWFRRHGVALTVQDDGCVFPASQDAETIVNCLLQTAKQLGVSIFTEHSISNLEELGSYDFIAIAAGGGLSLDSLQRLTSYSLCESRDEVSPGIKIEPPVPSLFSLSIDDPALQRLMGTVVKDVSVGLASTKLTAHGALLVTHWGVSGPAILRLSSYGARLLAENGYHMKLVVNWCHADEAAARRELDTVLHAHAARQIENCPPFGLQQRLWAYLVAKTLDPGKTCGRLGKKDINRLVNVLTADTYDISGRAPFRDEFVTCGGVALTSVNPATLESRASTRNLRPRLFFAGEVLDIDGITGGFNFQAAWTTAFVAAESIASQAQQPSPAL